MKIVNDTAYCFAPIAGRLNFPGSSLTCILKGTFDLLPGNKAIPSEDPLHTAGDEFYPDDEDKKGAPRYESDFAYFKPRADLLLAGRCHPPGGSSVPVCDVTFRVGDKSRTLRISGNRRWEKRWLRWVASEPEPFTGMDIRWENSFGGQKIKKNPRGKGGGSIKDDRGTDIWPLPNIEDPTDAVESPKSVPEPAGFGPLGRMWETRHAKTGTYTGDYAETRWPWFPEDFDWGHFNSAPPGMQVEGYLRGNEKLFFENLHPKHPQYHAQLPGIRIRCFFNKVIESGKLESNFEEVSMNLDTLWVDMEAEKLILVWRGWTRVLSEDYAEVEDIFILSEPLEQPPASIDECYSKFREKSAEQEEALDFEAEEPEAAGTEPEEAADPGTPAPKKPGIDPAYLQAQTNALLAQMGIDPESLPPEARERQSRIFQKLATTDPEKIAEMERRELGARIRESFSKFDLDPDNLPPTSARAKAEQLRFFKALGVKPADIAADPELGKTWALVGAALPKVGIDPENLSPLIEQVRKRQKQVNKLLGMEEEEQKSKKESKAPPLTRDDVLEQAACGESFEGKDLHGLDLSGLELQGLDFSKANITGASLAGTNLQTAILVDADLTGADLSGANLTGANLGGADLSKSGMGKAVLKDADLTGCTMIGVDLTGAVMTGAVLERAQMAGAVLDEVDAGDANFSGADLTESRFRKSACSGADFSKAVLDSADFQGADLREASLEGSIGRKINLSEADLTKLRASEGCDFTEGIFWNAIGPESIWENCNLTGSDLRGARMESAVFTGACLKQADLSFANMKFGRFNKANLDSARLIRMNLFQGNLEKADLTGADLSGSNMYGVEFLDAIVKGIRTEGTNLKMSKLQRIMTQA